MKRIEDLLAQGELTPLRQGLVKETYRHKDAVIGLVRVDKLDVHDRDPLMLRDSVRKYVDGLQSAGVPIVDVAEVELQGSNLVMVTKFMPQFLDLAMKASEVDFAAGSNLMLSDIARTKDTQVGIDPTPKNFAYAHDQIWYADFFYPITREYSEWKKSRMTLDTPRRRWIHFAQDYFYYPHVYTHAACDLADVGIQTRDETLQLVTDFCQQRGFGIDLKSSLDHYQEIRIRHGQQKH